MRFLHKLFKMVVTFKGIIEGSQMDRDQILTALGRAVAARWGDLPTSVQRELFEAAIRGTTAGAREILAAYLHQQHPRTIDGEQVGRQAPEPDSLGG